MPQEFINLLRQRGFATGANGADYKMSETQDGTPEVVRVFQGIRTRIVGYRNIGGRFPDYETALWWADSDSRQEKVIEDWGEGKAVLPKDEEYR